MRADLLAPIEPDPEIATSSPAELTNLLDAANATAEQELVLLESRLAAPRESDTIPGPHRAARIHAYRQALADRQAAVTRLAELAGAVHAVSRLNQARADLPPGLLAQLDDVIRTYGLARDPSDPAPGTYAYELLNQFGILAPAPLEPPPGAPWTLRPILQTTMTGAGSRRVRGTSPSPTGPSRSRGRDCAATARRDVCGGGRRRGRPGVGAEYGDGVADFPSGYARLFRRAATSS